MEKNGELDSSFMAVDPVSPASNNSKDLLDEPAAPRRNSTDDNDPTRPRKRLAAMAIHDDMKDVEVAVESPREASSPLQDRASQLALENCHSGDEGDHNNLGDEEETVALTAGGVGKSITIHLRSSALHQPEENQAQDGYTSDRMNGSTQSTVQQAEQLQSLDSPQVTSPNGSLHTPDVEIEEIEEMDEGEDHLSSHITIVKNYLNNPVNTGGPDRVKGLMDNMVSKLERDPCPMRELDEILSSVSNFVNVVDDQMDIFWKAYTTNHDIWLHLPNLMETLLRRSELFGNAFFRRSNNGLSGVDMIGRLMVEFTRLTTLFMHYDVLVMKESPLDAEVTLISCQYLRILVAITRPNHLFNLLERTYHVALSRQLPEVIRALVEKTDSLKMIQEFQELMYGRMSSQPKLATHISHPIDVFSRVVRCMEHVMTGGFLDADLGDVEEPICRSAFLMLPTAEKAIMAVLESHLQVLHFKEFTGTIEGLCQLEGSVCKTIGQDSQTKAFIMEKTRCRYPDLNHSEYQQMAEWTCRFPILLKMMMCSRMDFRLHGLVRATDLLVRAWKENSGPDWRDSNLLRFLADFILEQKVIEYIVGPESHPELIRRSANLTGFLLVTQTITPEIQKALWQPILVNKDPRIFQATLAMHQDMIGNMTLEGLVGLSKRLKELPFSAIDSHVINFICRFMEQIRTSVYTRGQHNVEDMCLDAGPFELLISLIRMASREEDKPTIDTGLSASAIFDFGARELRGLTGYGPNSTARREIFLECINDIKAMNPSATGSVSVILAFLQNRPPLLRAGSPTFNDDIEYLVGELKLAEILIEEICGFVESHREKEQMSRIRRLKLRLELLQYIMSVAPECLPPGLDEKLWTYLVGASALGQSERDVGFEFYITHFSNCRGCFDPILEHAFRRHFPVLDPAYFSSHVLNFCKMSIDYLNRSTEVQRQPEMMEEDSLNVDGIEQLWRIILDANNEILASDASTYLVNFYLDSRAVLSKPPGVVEATHFKMVERCIAQLNSAALDITGSEVTDGSPMALDSVKDNTFQNNERVFQRSLDLLDQFIKGYKNRSEYNKGFQEQSQGSGLEMITGLPLTIRLRWHGFNYQSPVHTFKIGNLDTAQDLHERITKLVGGDKHRTVCAGRELKLSEDPLKTLKDFGLSDDASLIVQKAPDQGSNTVVVRPSSNLNALEAEIMRHFDALYRLLGLPEPQAARIWVFLRNLPVHDKLKESMISGESWSQTLPAEQPYKILYFLYTLRACFGEQRAQLGSEASEFFARAISCLLETVMSDGLETDTGYSLSTKAQVTNDLLDCLRMFLEEPIAEENPTSYLTDSAAFVRCILNILQTISKPEYSRCTASEDCVVNAFRALLRASRMDPETWITLSQNQDQMFSAIDKFLVRDDRPKVRQGVSRAIVGTLKRPMRNDIVPCEGFAKYFWQILDTLLVQESINPDSSAEFYHAALVIFQFLGNTDAASLELDHYLSTWSSRLIEYPVTEIVGRPKEDYILTGLSKLLSRCTAFAREQGIAVGMKVSERIFERLLFPTYVFGDQYQDIEVAERLPCLHGPTRTEIYTLLLELVNDLESSTRMVALNRQLFPRGKRLVKINGNVLYVTDDALHDSHIADRTRWARSSAGHVGLQNMSNTCYLNSLIAQLFMNRSFRAFILDMDVNSSDESQRLLFSMKVLFARMQNSYAKAVEPKDFVESITDYEGEQIDITIQMDVDEFYNLIFDRLEGQMSSIQMKSSFRGYYGGQLVQQVKSSECEHISERNEPFSAIQCDIKGKTNLQESLKAYVGGEHMDGDNKYSCTECGRHVNAVKRTSLKDLPNGIIFHLKRFEFDLQTMHRSKINDKFEFPNCIDMTPYTTDFLSAEEKGKIAPPPDIFELVGVLVHSGTAESGHYYSYVRDRLSDSSNPQWLEFNDSEVSFFDPSTISSACYGGCDTMARDSMGQAFTVNKPYSAYMLFYERSSFLRSPNGNLGTVGFGRKLPLPHDLECEIQAENERFIRKYCMFDNSYIDFAKRLADQHHRLSKNSARSEHLSERKALLLALETFEQIATRFKDPGEAEALHGTIHVYLVSCPDCCLDFLNWISDKEEAIRNLLVCNPYPKPRQAVARLVLVALTQLRRKRAVIYGADDPNLGHDYGERESNSILYKVCNALIESWDGLQYTAKTWNDYFGLLANIACLGQFERSTMLELGYLKKTLQLLVIDLLPAPKKKEFMFDNFTKIWSKRRPPIGNAGSLLCELMSLCDPNLLPCLDNDRRIIDERCERYPLTRTEYDLFTFSDDRNAMTAITRLLESHNVNDAMANLVSNIVASEVAPVEGGILDLLKYTLINGVPVDPAQEALPFLTCLTQFIASTKSLNYVREIIRRVAEEIPTIGTDGGAEHLAFFQDLLKVRNPVIKATSIKFRILEQIGSWAPPLLVYCEVRVREETELFLNEILFDTLGNGDRPKARSAVEMLMDNCFTYLETRYTKQRHQCDEKTFESILRVLEKCGEYQSDEEVFKARYDNLRVLIEKMILEEEEDADLASDEWGGSEIGSDTHEMEVQLDDYNST